MSTPRFKTGLDAAIGEALVCSETSRQDSPRPRNVQAWAIADVEELWRCAENVGFHRALEAAPVASLAVRCTWMALGLVEGAAICGAIVWCFFF